MHQLTLRMPKRKNSGVSVPSKVFAGRVQGCARTDPTTRKRSPGAISTATSTASCGKARLSKSWTGTPIRRLFSKRWSRGTTNDPLEVRRPDGENLCGLGGTPGDPLDVTGPTSNEAWRQVRKGASTCIAAWPALPFLRSPVGSKCNRKGPSPAKRKLGLTIPSPRAYHLDFHPIRGTFHTALAHAAGRGNESDASTRDSGPSSSMIA